MHSNPVGWFEIYVQDMPRARRFYEAVFQARLEQLNQPEPEMWAFPGKGDRYGAPGSLVKMTGVPSGGSGTLVYFSCEDCAVEQQRVVENGGQVHKEKFSIGQFGHISLVVDTEGNMFGLHSMK